MITNFFDSNAAKYFYSLFLPILVFISLFIFATMIDRPYLLGSIKIDLFIRFLLFLWFSGLYFRLSRISTYRMYPNISVSKSEVVGWSKYYYISLCVIFSVGCGFITWWIIRWFFPPLINITGIIAGCNSLLVFLPLGSHYWVLKIL